MKFLCKTIWNLSELLGINLGKIAPYIFGYIIGNKPVKINETYTKICPNGHTCTFDDDIKEKFCMCGLEYDCTMDNHCCCDDCLKENLWMDR